MAAGRDITGVPPSKSLKAAYFSGKWQAKSNAGKCERTHDFFTLRSQALFETTRNRPWACPNRSNGSWRALRRAKKNPEYASRIPGFLFKRGSRPVSRVLCRLRGSSHSSRPAIAHWLKQPTRPQRGPRQWGPIWSCSGWSLPCRELLPVARCALTAPFHPYLIPYGPSAVCSLLHWS